MGNVIGIMLYVLLLAGLFVSIIWMIFTKRGIRKAGILKFLCTTIIWNGVLLGIYILSWKLSSHPAVFYVSPSEWLGIVCNRILSLYDIMLMYVFPIYTGLILIYAGYYFIRRKRGIR